NIPIWMPVLLAAIPTVILWHRDRRTVKAGCCLTCGYDLRASKKTCPECGAAVLPPQRIAPWSWPMAGVMVAFAPAIVAALAA
ncbi:MAG: hypothetical protein V3S19_02170, partial [Gemmatimonadales bacterium]